ncbi:glycosyltransferase family 2 protein [Plantibacter cousiniae (nom. nud.)]|uniref:glycosyltransferase family 2 protein n=1 Tax=Plantibacter cousiniae (nom. nud.) TaxID=199709 RepID=UPI001DCD35B7|nr:glycosyltransferase [Plantibacter cousiniae]CAH0159083.1 Hyaluronan synthase [Plantibacter cousiniae]
MTPPLFSVVTPVYNPPIDMLRQMVDSVRRQAFRDWELILVDDVSPDPAVLVTLRELAAEDDRIIVVAREVNGGISVASNNGIAAATGRFLVLVDHDDLLGHGALAQVARAIAADDRIDYVYTDEDKVDLEGYHYDVFKKPDWSPERLRSHMYLGHLSVMRLDIVRAVGGFDSANDGSQDHDLALKVTERARVVHHIPEILYHWRALPESTASSSGAKPYTWDAGVRAVGAHLERVGIDATAERGDWPNTYRVRRALDPATSVSVIIPTRGSSGVIHGVERVFVVGAVRSVIEHAGDVDLEIVVVYDLTTPETVLDLLREIAGDRLTLVPFDRPFNYGEKCNVGFVESRGDMIVLLNDDVEVISDGFLVELVAPLRQQDVGMTGAQLVYEDGLIQHAGHRYANRGFSHPMTGYRFGEPGPSAALKVDREVSGVTAACAALRRDTYASIGGVTEALPLNFNDVDLSLKVSNAGLRILYLARVQLFHYESKTRLAVVHEWELNTVRARWGVIYRDPFLPEHPDDAYHPYASKRTRSSSSTPDWV